MRKEGRGRLGGGARTLTRARGRCSRTARRAVGLRVPGEVGLRLPLPLAWLRQSQHGAGRGIGKAASANHRPRGSPAQAGPRSCPRAVVLKGRPLSARQSREIASGRRWAAGRCQVVCRRMALNPHPSDSLQRVYSSFPWGRGESIPPEFL